MNTVIAMNLFTDNDDNGNFVIKRFVDNKELRVSTNNIIELVNYYSAVLLITFIYTTMYTDRSW